MQRIDVDKYIESLSKKIDIKNINRQIKENIDNLIYWKRYFLNLWYPLSNLLSSTVDKFYNSKSKLLKQVKRNFLFNLQQKWILVCSYCWKTSNIHWELNDKLVRLYDIEHFLPRSKYPYLSVNLYNWLPVCKACNEILKGAIDTLQGTNRVKKLFHPYFWWIYRDWKYIHKFVIRLITANNRLIKRIIYFSTNYKLLKLSSIYKFILKKLWISQSSLIDIKCIYYNYYSFYKNRNFIKVEDKTFDEDVTFYWNEENDVKNRKQVFTTYHWKVFRLGEIYLNDQETFNIFQFIYDKYTQIKDEYNRFKKNSKSVEDFVDYFLKNYYPEDEQEILKFANWKLKKDLIENMKKILEEELETGK